jgi:predicted ATP-grasp superfamily ATP-dependent carboligase
VSNPFINSPADLLPFLDQLTFDRAVLIPCTDDWVVALSQLPASCKERFVPGTPPHKAVQALIDKGSLYQLLSSLGIAYPHIIGPISGAELPSLPIAHGSFYFLKPCDSQKFFRKYQVKAFLVGSDEELASRLQQLNSENLSVVLQEYVPGPVSNHIFIDGFIDRNGQWCAAFARKRLRIYPEHFGNSTYLETIPVDTVKVQLESLRTIFKAVSYRGVFSAEFKTDERDAQPRLLEINVRPWWYIWFAQSCGVPIAQMIYLDALQQPVNPVLKYEAGVGMVYPPFDFYACYSLWQHGELGLFSWAKSWLTARQAVFCLGDPMPSIVVCWDRFKRTVGQRLFPWAKRTP